jgi:prepilin-type processing-associated H-X9-DG protein
VLLEPPPKRLLPDPARASSPVTGTSLLELLIVVALIFVLFTLYFSGGSKNYQLRQIAKCESNLQNVYVSLRTYSLENHDQLPFLAGATTSEAPLSQLVPRSTTGTEFFTCPGSKDSPLPDAEPFANRRISYAYYMGHTIRDGTGQPLISDRQVNTNSKHAGEPLFSADGKKPGNNHNKYGGNVMFCDGAVLASPPRSSVILTNSTNVVLLNPKP